MPGEILQVQGIPWSADLPVANPWAEVMPCLTDDDARNLGGNSIHPLSSGQLTLWVLAAAVPRRFQTKVAKEKQSRSTEHHQNARDHTHKQTGTPRSNAQYT